MKTSCLLPEECREEIRTYMNDVLGSWEEQGRRGGLTAESEWLLRGWKDALKHVLGDDGK